MIRFGLFCLLALASSALWAHAYLVKSIPAQRAVLHHSPAKIELWFSERLEPKYSSFVLRDAKGKLVETEKAEVGSDDPKRLSVRLAPLVQGRYLVKYRVLSVDGHIVEGEVPFSVGQ